jgi:ankyrin repeat protein
MTDTPDHIESPTSGDLDSDAVEEQGVTPLMEAARWGRVDAVRLLTESGANVNVTTGDGWTALHAACVGKHCNIIELLLSHNANPHIYSYHRDFDEELGWHFSGTPLHVAAANGNVPVSELLLAVGASVAKAWELDQRTPLFYAAAYGHAAMIALLCEHGANPNCREHSHEYTCFLDRTPLHYAARNGHVEAAKVLLSCGAESKAIESNSGKTAVQMARAQKHEDVVAVLREKQK